MRIVFVFPSVACLSVCYVCLFRTLMLDIVRSLDSCKCHPVVTIYIRSSTSNWAFSLLSLSSSSHRVALRPDQAWADVSSVSVSSSSYVSHTIFQMFIVPLMSPHSICARTTIRTCLAMVRSISSSIPDAVLQFCIVGSLRA